MRVVPATGSQHLRDWLLLGRHRETVETQQGDTDDMCIHEPSGCSPRHPLWGLDTILRRY